MLILLQKPCTSLYSFSPVRQLWYVLATFAISSSVNSKVLRLIKWPRLRASINNISRLRFCLLRLRNQRQAGICVFKNNFAGRFTMQSIRSFSINALRISPSLLVLVVSEPFIKNKNLPDRLQISDKGNVVSMRSWHFLQAAHHKPNGHLFVIVHRSSRCR